MIDSLGQSADRPQLEDIPDAQFHAALGADRGDQFGGHQRMTTQVEERVVDADAIPAEQRGKQCGDAVFSGGGRVAILGAGGDVGLRQGGSVDLAVGRDRNLAEHHVARRRHVVGQRRGHPGTDAIDVNGFGPAAGRRGDVTDQTFAQPRQLDGQHDRLPDAGVHRDRGGDFAEFDAEAADFDLLVGAADELDVAVGVAAGQVARTVHPSARGERVGHEALGGQSGAAMIPLRDMRSGDVDFADHSDRHGLQRAVEQIHLSIDLGLADRHDPGALRALHRIAGAVDHGLGRSVEVVQQRVEGGMEFVGDLAGQRLAADGYPPQGAPLVDPRQRQEQSEQGRHEVHRGNSLAPEQVSQITDVA